MNHINISDYDKLVLNELINIAKKYSDNIEGNCYTYHESFNIANELINKQLNLITFSKKCSTLHNSDFEKTNILEIGFNAGHSAYLLLKYNPNVYLTCIDIGFHKYVEPCYNFLKVKFKDRINLIIANSIDISYLDSIFNLKFHGLHIDGCHENFMFIYDLISCLKLLYDSAYVIFDDTQNINIYKFYELCKNSILFHSDIDNSFLPTFLYKHEILKFIRPNIKICSLAYGNDYRDFFKKGIESKYLYSFNNNYKFIEESNLLDSSRPTPWSKIKLVIRELVDADIVVWIDADSIIMNFNHSIEEFLLLFNKNKFLLIGHDIGSINSGVFFIRNTPDAFNFLNLAYNQNHLINDPWWDQAAFIKIYPQFNHLIEVIPHNFIKLFNSYDPCADNLINYSDGDWLIHFAGGNAKLFINKYINIYNNKKNYDPIKTWNLLVEFIKYKIKL